MIGPKISRTPLPCAVASWGEGAAIGGPNGAVNDRTVYLIREATHHFWTLQINYRRPLISKPFWVAGEDDDL